MRRMLQGLARAFGGFGQPTQEEILSIANDAALEGDYKRALEVLSESPKERRITTSYAIITPESSEQGDFDETGWEDEEGDEIQIDADDIEEAAELGHAAPVNAAIAERAATWLKKRDAREHSGFFHHHNRGDWYSTDWDFNYSTGAEKQLSFHLEGFTADEERAVFEHFKMKMLRR